MYTDDRKIIDVAQELLPRLTVPSQAYNKEEKADALAQLDSEYLGVKTALIKHIRRTVNAADSVKTLREVFRESCHAFAAIMARADLIAAPLSPPQPDRRTALADAIKHDIPTPNTMSFDCPQDEAMETAYTAARNAFKPDAIYSFDREDYNVLSTLPLINVLAKNGCLKLRPSLSNVMVFTSCLDGICRPDWAIRNPLIGHMYKDDFDEPCGGSLTVDEDLKIDESFVSVFAERLLYLYANTPKDHKDAFSTACVKKITLNSAVDYLTTDCDADGQTYLSGLSHLLRIYAETGVITHDDIYSNSFLGQSNTYFLTRTVSPHEEHTYTPNKTALTALIDIIESLNVSDAYHDWGELYDQIHDLPE
jgi:hypothetical protein